MRTGKFSPGCTLRLGTDTLALPPGVKSCDCTSSVTPRIRRELEFRSESDVCKSSSIAPPRGLKVDSPQSALITVTGESSGSVMCIVLRGSSRPLWADAELTSTTAPTTARILLREDIVDRYLTRVRIHIASPQTPGRTQDHCRLLRFTGSMQQHQRISVFIQ